ncbi:hypothetical protein [Sphingomonas sp.]|uniref:hypothetical protein n=1 Tax=Sphingomonas sp. TaxID=28214 RepID=UPI0025EC244B|nr:hypothetical protein [Sphingomonas sp.]MBV9529456.1 hypothetical protein [Sphingomonas sp.]
MASLPLPALQQSRPSVVAVASDVVGTVAPARLSALEWSIVAMAERDSLSSIREPSRYTRVLRAFFGLKQPNRLASDRLETLRRVSVLAWLHGWNVPKSELVAFREAGFSNDQFELIQNSLGQARASARRRKHAR